MNATKAIFKTFFLSLCVIANIHFAFAQTTGGIIPNGQNVFLDNNGKPLSGGKVFFYTGNVGSTVPKTTFQDINLTTPNTNPVILDASGRPHSGTGLWGTGNYRQVVQDKNNNLIWDVLTSAAGSGSSGGGGTATGDGDLVGTIKPWAGMTAPNQYMFAYGAQISRTTFSALFTAITSAQSVFCNSGSPILNGLGDTTNFWIGMTVEVSCVPTGVSTVLSKTSGSVTLNANANVTVNTNATFFPWGNGNGVNTFTLPDLRGVVPMGNNIMGGVASSNMSDVNFGPQGASSSGALGGSQSEALLPSNAPNVSNTFIGIQGTATSTGNFATGLNLSSSNAASGGGINFGTSVSVAAVSSTFTPTGTISSLAGGIAVSSTIVAAGSAYPVSSSVTLTVVGGTCSIAPQFTVSTSGGGALTGSPTLLTAGQCSVVPSNPVATTSSGTGTGGTLNVIYSAVPFSLVQPSRTINYIVKVTPDANSATANGVTSLGGMIGSIACGANLTCTGNTISANSSGVNSINGETGNITLGNGLSIAANVLSAAVGVDSNVLAGGAVITSAPTVNSTFCGTIAALGGNAFYSFTVGAAFGFPANCVITIANVDGWTSGRGKNLSISGLSVLPFGILYPTQIVKLRNISNAWVASPDYQLVQVPLGQKFFVDIANGSDSNDCLATGSGNACQSITHVVMGLIWSQFLANAGSSTGGSPGFDIRLATNASCVPTTGVGCYAGLHFSGAPKQVEGFNSIMIECDGGSATNCTIADNTGNCAIGLFNASINLELKNVTLAGGSGNNCDIEATAGQVRIESGVVLGPTGSTSVAQLQADGTSGKILVEGGNTVTVAAGTSGWLAACSFGGGIQLDGATFSFAGNVTYGQQTLAANSPCFLSATSVTWTLNAHTVTAAHNINAANGGMVITGGAFASVPGTNAQNGTTPLPGWYN